MVLPSRDNFVVFGDICHKEGTAAGIWWVEARGDGKYPTMLKTVPATRNYAVQDIRCC